MSTLAVERTDTNVGESESFITPHDFCDQCGTARAVAFVVMRSGKLYFCRHHLRHNYSALQEAGVPILSDLDIPSEVLLLSQKV